jgi:DNA-binding CsgD family transcriptional regulator
LHTKSSAQPSESLDRARHAWAAGDIAAAETFARESLDAVSGPEAHEVLAQVAYGREETGAAAEELQAAIAGLAGDDPRLAPLLVQLAWLASERAEARFVETVRAKRGAVPATPETAIARGAIALNLARFALVDGDAHGAWALAREAEGVAVTASAKAAALSEQAAILRRLGDTFASEFLAIEAARTALVAETDSDLRESLLAAAVEIAGSDTSAAMQLLNRADDVPMQTLGPIDRIPVAMDAYARAMVHGSGGQRQSGQKSLERAFVVFDTVEFVWRAAEIALDLAASGRREYLPDARELCALIPNSWLAKRCSMLVTGSDDERVAALTPAQRDVLYALCAGKSAKQIAADFDRSPFTIRNHTKEVFRVFEVRSRSSLVAECARAGIYPPRDGVRLPRRRRRV